MGDSPSTQLNEIQSTTNSTASKHAQSQVKSPQKKKPAVYHSSSVWVGAVGGGIAVVDRRYNISSTPRPKDPGTPIHRTQSHDERANSSSTLALTSTSTNTSFGVASDESLRHPYAMRLGRRYLSDPQSLYPLPVDLPELHRQVLRTMLLVNVFGGPLCSPMWRNKPPKKVLEVGCGNAYWSALCHKHFARQGHSVSFTGIDIAPVASEMKANGMKWRFVQHDLRKLPIPFKDEGFDLIMVKDLSLISSAVDLTANLMEEYFRCLRPGGQVEVWDGDHTIRMLLAHTSPNAQDSDSEEEDQAQADGTGTYIMTVQTPFKPAHNQYLTDYNTWLTKVFHNKGFSVMPCTSMASQLLQEPELTDIQSRRIAIPLGEVRWERGDVGSSAKGKDAEAPKRILTAGQAALRHTALLTVVQYIESLEPFLREASGKSQDEWDRWYSDMMDDLLTKNGTSWGECLEVGAWWATKKAKPIPKAKPKAKPPSEKSERPAKKPISYPPDPHPGNEWKPPMELL